MYTLKIAKSIESNNYQNKLSFIDVYGVRLLPAQVFYQILFQRHITILICLAPTQLYSNDIDKIVFITNTLKKQKSRIPFEIRLFCGWNTAKNYKLNTFSPREIPLTPERTTSIIEASPTACKNASSLSLAPVI